MAPSSPARPARIFVLFRIKGVELAFTPSWLITVTFLALIIRTSDLIPASLGKVAGAAVAVGITLMFYSFVVLHEAAHTIVAHIFGLQPRRILLFMLGGVSQIGRDAEEPRQEYLVALAGPAASLLIYGVLAIVSLVVNQDLEGVWGTLAIVNLMLAGFNLIPGFPLDGGRVLRATIWAIGGDRVRATRVAANGGRIVAAALVAVGVMWLLLRMDNLTEGVAGIWYIVLGYFLYSFAGDAGRLEIEREVIREQARLDAIAAVAENEEISPAGDIVPQEPPAGRSRSRRTKTSSAILAGPARLSDIPETDRAVARDIAEDAKSSRVSASTDIVPKTNGTKAGRVVTGKAGAATLGRSGRTRAGARARATAKTAKTQTKPNPNPARSTKKAPDNEGNAPKSQANRGRRRT